SPTEDSSATLLSNGQVLLAGGYAKSQRFPLSCGELYDPATETWGATGAPNITRPSHTTTPLRSGKVLVAGGIHGYCCDDVHNTVSSTEVFDPRMPATDANVCSFRFDVDIVRAGDSFTATFLGSGLTNSTYFDVRYLRPWPH